MRERTGLTIDPYFSGTKIEWLLRNVEGAERAVFGTIDSWLLFKLTGGHVTDYSNASRTMLFDIRRLDWDEELCELLGVDPARLPRAAALRLRLRHHERVRRRGAGRGGRRRPAGGALRPGLPPPGDGEEHLRHRQLRPPQHRRRAAAPPDGLLATVAWGLGEEVTYALEASIFVTGAAVQWLRDGLGIIDEAGETEALAASLDSNDGVYFVPALTGLGSPHWDPYARGTIVGLTRGSGRAHLARAALEAIAYQTVDAVRAQEAACGERLELLKADGGAVVNRWLMQFQADVLGVPVVVPEIAETTALGAAYLAGIATGVWTAEQVGEMWREADRYEPRMEAARREALLADWRRALERSRDWAR